MAFSIYQPSKLFTDDFDEAVRDGETPDYWEFEFDGSEIHDCANCGELAKVPTSTRGYSFEADADFYQLWGDNPKADENWQRLCLGCAEISTLRFDGKKFYEVTAAEHQEDVDRELFSQDFLRKIRSETERAIQWRADFQRSLLEIGYQRSKHSSESERRKMAAHRKACEERLAAALHRGLASKAA